MTLPDEIKLHQLGDRYVYRLPYRNTRDMRAVGCGMIAMSLVGIVFLAFWMYTPIADGLKQVQQNQNFGWLMIGFGCLGIFGLAAATVGLISGIAVLFDRTYCTLTLNGHQLACTERLFFLRRKRKCKLDEIDKLVLVDFSAESTDALYDHQTTAKFKAMELIGVGECCLIAERKDGAPFCVAAAYNKSLLSPLAEELAPRLNSQALFVRPKIRRGESHESDDVDRITIVDTADLSADDVKPQKPISTNVKITYRDDGITVSVPAGQSWQGKKSMIMFSIMWNMLSWVLFTFAIVDIRTNWLAVLFLLPFVAIGVVIILSIVHQNSCETVIATAGDSLFVRYKSRVFSKAREWHREQILRVSTGFSGVSYNEEQVDELKIEVEAARAFGCLSQLNTAELQWIASEINSSLDLENRLEGTYSFRDEEGRPKPIVGSKIKCERSDSETKLVLPGKPAWTQLPQLAMGVALIGFSTGFSIFVLRQKQDFGVIAFLAIWAPMMIAGGFAAVLFGFHNVLRHYVIVVTQSQILVRRRGLFGTGKFQIDADEMDYVEVIDTGWKFNEKSVYQLHLGRGRRKPVKVSGPWNEQDFRFIAATINETMLLKRASSELAEDSTNRLGANRR